MAGNITFLGFFVFFFLKTIYKCKNHSWLTGSTKTYSRLNLTTGQSLLREQLLLKKSIPTTGVSSVQDLELEPLLHLNTEVKSKPIRCVGSPCGSVVKNLPASVGAAGDVGSIPVSGRSVGGGNDNPLQYSCLKNPMDRGVWWVQSMGTQRSQARLSVRTHTWDALGCLLVCFPGVTWSL